MKSYHLKLILKLTWYTLLVLVLIYIILFGSMSARMRLHFDRSLKRKRKLKYNITSLHRACFQKSSK